MTKSILTDDVFAAAYMLAMGARLVRPVPGPFVRWLFENEDGTARRLLDGYQSGKDVPVDAHRLLDCHARLRRDIVMLKRARGAA
jgi:hypothetical protein